MTRFLVFVKLFPDPGISAPPRRQHSLVHAPTITRPGAGLTRSTLSASAPPTEADFLGMSRPRRPQVVPERCRWDVVSALSLSRSGRRLSGPRKIESSSRPATGRRERLGERRLSPDRRPVGKAGAALVQQRSDVSRASEPRARAPAPRQRQRFPQIPARSSRVS